MELVRYGSIAKVRRRCASKNSPEHNPRHARALHGESDEIRGQHIPEQQEKRPSLVKYGHKVKRSNNNVEEVFEGRL
jgi:hypothetical protein